MDRKCHLRRMMHLMRTETREVSFWEWQNWVHLTMPETIKRMNQLANLETLEAVVWSTWALINNRIRVSHHGKCHPNQEQLNTWVVTRIMFILFALILSSLVGDGPNTHGIRFALVVKRLVKQRFAIIQSQNLVLLYWVTSIQYLYSQKCTDRDLIRMAKTFIIWHNFKNRLPRPLVPLCSFMPSRRFSSVVFQKHKTITLSTTRHQLHASSLFTKSQGSPTVENSGLCCLLRWWVLCRCSALSSSHQSYLEGMG